MALTSGRGRRELRADHGSIIVPDAPDDIGELAILDTRRVRQGRNQATDNFGVGVALLELDDGALRLHHQIVDQSKQTGIGHDMGPAKDSADTTDKHGT